MHGFKNLAEAKGLRVLKFENLNEKSFVPNFFGKRS